MEDGPRLYLKRLAGHTFTAALTTSVSTYMLYAGLTNGEDEAVEDSEALVTALCFAVIAELLVVGLSLMVHVRRDWGKTWHPLNKCIELKNHFARFASLPIFSTFLEQPRAFSAASAFGKFVIAFVWLFMIVIIVGALAVILPAAADQEDEDKAQAQQIYVNIALIFIPMVEFNGGVAEYMAYSGTLEKMTFP